MYRQLPNSACSTVRHTGSGCTVHIDHLTAEITLSAVTHLPSLNIEVFHLNVEFMERTVRQPKKSFLAVSGSRFSGVYASTQSWPSSPSLPRSNNIVCAS